MEQELDKNVGRDMTPRLIGDTFRKYPTEKSNQKRTYGLFECQYCKKEFECQVSSVKNKGTISCGCQKNRIIKEQHSINISHGMAKHRFYKKWNQMIRRCTNTKDIGYENYGGRGIKVCEDWLDPKTFLAWCDATFPNIEGYSLDRIDNDKGYSPENCTWSSRTIQNINQRIQKSNTSGFVGVMYIKNKDKWAVSLSYLGKRVYIGSFLTIEEAVLARDNYIIENKLPHKLSTEYKRED